MNKKKAIIQLLVGCLILALFVFLAHHEEIKLPIDPTEPSSSQDPDVDYGKRFFEENGNLVLDIEWGLKAGKLHCEFSNIRMVNHRDDIPRLEGFRDDAQCSFPGLADNEIYDEKTVFRYPDFILENGEFIPNAYLLLMDVTVTSIGAAAYTIHDRDSEGYPKGQYTEECLFRADPIINLTNKTQYIKGESQFFGIDYFSDMNKEKENRMLFRLLPGETISFTLGFLVDDEKYGGKFDLDELTLCDIMGEGATFIPLKPYLATNLGEN